MKKLATALGSLALVAALAGPAAAATPKASQPGQPKAVKTTKGHMVKSTRPKAHQAKAPRCAGSSASKQHCRQH